MGPCYILFITVEAHYLACLGSELAFGSSLMPCHRHLVVERSGLPCLVGVARVVKVLGTARGVAACARSVGSTLRAVLVGRFSRALRPDSLLRLSLGHR